MAVSAILNLAYKKILPKGARRAPGSNMSRKTPSTIVNNKTSVIKQNKLPPKFSFFHWTTTTTTTSLLTSRSTCRGEIFKVVSLGQSARGNYPDF